MSAYHLEIHQDGTVVRWGGSVSIAVTPSPTRDETVGMTVDDLIDNIDDLLASRTPESTKGDT